MTLSVLIADFLEYLELERNVSQLTIRNYDHYLNRFLEFANDIDPKDIDLNLVRKYRLYLLRWTDPTTKKALKKLTQNYFLIALRAFLRYLTERGISTLPSQEVHLGRVEAKPFEALDETQRKFLLGAPDLSKKDGQRDKAILETLFSTGLRVSELTSLDRNTIDLQSRKFEVFGKGGKRRTVYLSESASLSLGSYLMARKDGFKPLFVRFQGKVDVAGNGEAMRLTPRSIERIVAKYAKKLGFSVKATPKILRHSFATDLFDNGVDIRSVAEKLGHLNISTTRRLYPGL